jgi:hypothetical protein
MEMRSNNAHDLCEYVSFQRKKQPNAGCLNSRNTIKDRALLQYAQSNYITVSRMQKVHKFLPFRVIGLEKIEVVVPLVTDHLRKQGILTVQLISNSFSRKDQELCRCIKAREKIQRYYFTKFQMGKFVS